MPFARVVERISVTGRVMTSKKLVRPGDRISVLRLRQTLKMARSAHAYVRGTTVQFYDWLEASYRGKLPEGPPVWICGDCHAGNLGPVAALDGASRFRSATSTRPSSAIPRTTSSAWLVARHRLPRLRSAGRHDRAHFRAGGRGLSGGAAARRRRDRGPARIDTACHEAIGRTVVEALPRSGSESQADYSARHQFWALSKTERGEIARCSRRRRAPSRDLAEVARR